MKKYRYLFLVFLTAIVSGLYLVSCGSDSDGDGEGGKPKSQILGTWAYISSSGEEDAYIMLCADGTGYVYDSNSSEYDGVPYVEKFEYLYDEEDNYETLTFIFGNSSATYHIAIITDTKLVLTQSGDNQVYKKTTSTYTAAQLERIYRAQNASSSY